MSFVMSVLFGFFIVCIIAILVAIGIYYAKFIQSIEFGDNYDSRKHLIVSLFPFGDWIYQIVKKYKSLKK